MDVARDLLGAVLVHDSTDGLVAGRVVETEAYDGMTDAASHAWRGERPHLAALFGAAGTVYVYRSYGVHWCVNVVTAPERHGSAVLLRAVEPIDGWDLMRCRRGRVGNHALASGPGKLTQAFGITGEMNGTSWAEGPLGLYAGESVPDASCVVTARVGITRAADALMRFALRGSPFVSRPRR